MIARDLQRARNTRITEGNEPGLTEVRSTGNRSQSPLRSVLKQGAPNQPVKRDLSESFARQTGHHEKLE